jgi:hypothetical protein
MIVEQIIDIVIKILATLLALGAGWLGTYLINLVRAKLSATNAEKLDLFVAELVAAAEQLYKAKDPTGTIRFDYVKTMLVQSGYEITDAVKALIEAKVFDINTLNAMKAGEVK